MHKKIQAILILLVALLIVSAAIYTNAQTPRVSDEMLGGDKRDRDATASDPFVDPCAYFTKADNERCTILDLLMLHGAEMTYASKYGNGNYAIFSQLINSGLIPPIFATGPSHGYLYSVGWVNGTPWVPATFRFWAVPMVYGRTGVRSFFMDTSGVLRGADRHGLSANENDPIIEICTDGSIFQNERCTIGSLRTLHGAEMTYASTYGNGSYTRNLTALVSLGLVDSRLATGQLRGYSFSIGAFPQTPTVPATFKINSTPQIYGTTGIRSFYVDTDGVIRGADKQGEPANENDPPITD